MSEWFARTKELWWSRARKFFRMRRISKLQLIQTPRRKTNPLHMRKKSNSQSAFFNLRVLIGLFIVLAGVFLALIGLGTFSGLTASSAQAQQNHKIINVPGLPPGFDCAQIRDARHRQTGEFSGGTHHDCLRRGTGRFTFVLRCLLSASPYSDSPAGVWRCGCRSGHRHREHFAPYPV